MVRKARTLYDNGPPAANVDPLALDVEVRDLALDNRLVGGLVEMQP